MHWSNSYMLTPKCLQHWTLSFYLKTFFMSVNKQKYYHTLTRLLLQKNSALFLFENRICVVLNGYIQFNKNMFL